MLSFQQQEDACRAGRRHLDEELRKAAMRGAFLIEALCNPDSGVLEAIANALPDDGPAEPGVDQFSAALDAVIASQTPTKEKL